MERFHLEEKLKQAHHEGMDLTTPTGISNALLTLRTQLPKEEFADPSSILQELFSRYFAESSFTVRRLDRDSDTNILTDVLAMDKVHPVIDNGAEVERRRTDPHTVFYGMFHASQRPVMLLQVSLQPEIPHCLDQIFAETNNAQRHNTVAVFYSISSLEDGLAGLRLGERFLHAVMEELRETQGSSAIDTFVTLSPMPLFQQWLEDQGIVDAATRERDQLLRWAARYLVPETGFPFDPVARFHMSNGAQLYRINHHPSNLKESYGCMVNYLYDLKLLKERKDNFPQQLAINHALLPRDGSVTSKVPLD